MTEYEVIDEFNRVLDCPFDCSKENPKPSSVVESNYMFIKSRRGSCSSKHYYLASLLENLGVEVKFVSYPFLWSDLEIAWPNSLRDIVPRIPPQWHLALMLNDGLCLDATWDPALINIGFDVNQHLENLGSTKLAVKPISDGIIHNSAIERWTYFQIKKNDIPSRSEVYSFYNQFNNWLISFRG